MATMAIPVILKDLATDSHRKHRLILSNL